MTPPGDPLDASELEGLANHACSSGTSTPGFVREKILRLIAEVRSHRAAAASSDHTSPGAIEIAREWLAYATRFGIVAEIHNGVYTEEQCRLIARAVVALTAERDSLRNHIMVVCHEALSINQQRRVVWAIREAANHLSEPFSSDKVQRYYDAHDPGAEAKLIATPWTGDRDMEPRVHGAPGDRRRVIFHLHSADHVVTCDFATQLGAALLRAVLATDHGQVW